MGLPTPNIFAGGNDFHSVREWVTVQDMAISAATVVELLRLLAEELTAGQEAGRCRAAPAGRASTPPAT